MKIKVYLSDEGFGHIVRQRAIVESIRSLEPDASVAIQTDRYFDFARKLIPTDQHIRRFNNILWHKKEDSSPDLSAIEAHYSKYSHRSEAFLAEEEGGYDLVISDFVYEAFEFAKNNGMKAYGVSHFTWDWFFAKLYPPPISRKVLRTWFRQAQSASILFFPPFTPFEILNHYKANAVEVPFIVRSDPSYKNWPVNAEGRFKILLMDSGAQLMKNVIQRAFSVKESTNDQFYIASPYELEIPDSFTIPKGELLVDYVQEADLVVGRPGFNTVSECVSNRVPMLLISENMNPEMEHNINELKKRRLGAFISYEEFEQNFISFLDRFLKMEYENLKDAMNSHSFETDGADQIAHRILEDYRAG